MSTVGKASLSLDRIADSKAACVAEYRKRRNPNEFVKISAAELASYEASGWVHDRELVSGVRLKRAKSLDEQLENQFWILLYLLGYERLNIGRRFSVAVDVSGKTLTKQLDVVGFDDETVVVAECKSANSKKGKTLQKDLSELDSLKRPIANAIRSYLGRGAKPKIIWFMVTSRIRWSDNDLLRATEKNIVPVREQELRYFMEMAKALGKAAKYQFHAEFLSGQKIPALSGAWIPASRFKLAGRTAYSFTIRSTDLLRRAFVNHRDLRDPAGAPSYQRLVNPGRIKSIGKFLDKGGYFANSVLLNFHSNVRFDIADRDDDADTRFGRLYLPETYKSVWIIDGQHRIYGAALVENDDQSIVLPAVAFESLPAEEEALLFATINREQRQVQKKLLDELDGELKWGSDDLKEAIGAIAARALDFLRSEVLGPFEDKIALPGTKDRTQPLTVPQLKPAILQSGLIGRVSARDGQYLPGPLTGPSHTDTLSNLCSFLTSFFADIRDANPDRWDSATVPLCHNVAVPALIRLSAEAVKYASVANGFDPHSLDPSELAIQALSVVGRLKDFIVEATDDEFRERFPITFGAGGPKRYLMQAAALIQDDRPEFEVEGLKEYLSSTDVERTERADKMVKSIVDRLHGHVVEKLREAYGDSFFEKAIRQKDIKIRAYTKRAESDPDGHTPLENYLDVIELRKIVESNDNWALFKDTLNIPLPDDKKGQQKYLRWIDSLNKVRKIFAHPFNRSYDISDIELLEYLDQRIPASDYKNATRAY